MGKYVSVRGSFNLASGAPGGYRVVMTSDGPIAGAAPASAKPFAQPSGRFVDLEGTRAEVMSIDAEIVRKLYAAPSPLSLVLESYKVPSIDERIVGAGFAAAYGINDWLTSDNVAVSTLPAAQLLPTLADRMALHSGTPTEAALRAALGETIDAMLADGATGSYSAAQEDSGDYSYFSIVVTNRAAGTMHILGLRIDP